MNPDVTREDIEREVANLRALLDEYPSFALLLDKYDPDAISLHAIHRASLELRAKSRPTAGQRKTLQDRQAAFRTATSVVNRQYVDGEITLQEWSDLHRQQIKDLHISAYMAGMDGEWSDMNASDWGRVGQIIRTQYAYLANWASQLAGTEEPSLAQMNQRSGYYAAAASNSFSQGRATRAGFRPSELPAHPGDGSTECRCIITPWSRVTTRRGEVPISSVRVGDEVRTHRGRWRRVTHVVTKPSRPGHKLMLVRRPGGEWVGMTQTHRVRTGRGWRALSDISSYDFVFCRHPEPATHDASILPDLRQEAVEQEQARPLQRVFERLRLWAEERLPSRVVHKLWTEPITETCMEAAPVQVLGWPSTSWQETSDSIRRSEHRFELDTEGRRTVLPLLLGEREEAHHLPLPVGVAAGERPYPPGYAHPPYQRGLRRRSFGESGNAISSPAPRDPRQRATSGVPRQNAGVDVSGLREDVQGEVYEGAPGEEVLQSSVPEARLGDRSGYVDVQSLWEYVSSHAVGVEGEKAAVLFAGLLEPGTPLYDITVEGDHSYFIEGVSSHNSNCKCHWRIVTVSKRRGDYNCTWMLGNAEHCRTCRRRAKIWRSLKIRGGRLETEVEPIAAA